MKNLAKVNVPNPSDNPNCSFGLSKILPLAGIIVIAGAFVYSLLLFGLYLTLFFVN
jgi:hypothetical protein